jgi:RNA polymerase sigma-70 factor (ECF subfamily)
LYLEDTKIINLAHDETDSSLLENDLLQLLKLLPDGCKTIFNLFVIEGYSHKEIAQQLQISEGTSKSQLNVAKTKLKELVQLHFYHQAK